MAIFCNSYLLRTAILIIVACVIACLNAAPLIARNDKPIIGVVTQEYRGKLHSGSSYIPASYIKFLESAGARVVPIMINKPKQYYETLFNSLNGVLFPGGGASLDASGYGKAGKILFDLAVKANDRGDYFPLWGTCLGFELLCFLAGNSTNVMEACSAHDLAKPMPLLPGYENSRLFRNASAKLLEDLQTKPVTINYHQWCVSPQNFTANKLDRFFRVLSHNKDINGLEFVSLIEGIKYPFYAIATHPEKNLFEFVEKKGQYNIPHFPEAITTSQYFANFFVNEARKNNHRFNSKQEEDATLIYNFNPENTGIKNSSYQQTYFFNMTDNMSNRVL